MHPSRALSGASSFVVTMEGVRARHHKVLRKVPVAKVMAEGESFLREAQGDDYTYGLSEPLADTPYNDFMSHTWRSNSLAKRLAMLYQYNLRQLRAQGLSRDCLRDLSAPARLAFCARWDPTRVGSSHDAWYSAVASGRTAGCCRSLSQQPDAIPASYRHLPLLGWSRRLRVPLLWPADPLSTVRHKPAGIL